MSELSKFIGVPQSKKYDGKEYILYNGYRHLADARRIANGLREDGWKARVVLSGNKGFPYVIYYRPKDGWKTPGRK